MNDENTQPIEGGPLDGNVRAHSAPPVVTETEDWKLGCFMEWRPKSHAVECDYCHGKGEVGGGFKDLDGARQCPECFGSRIKHKSPTTTKPEIPAALREHMRRAWWDFLNAL